MNRVDNQSDRDDFMEDLRESFKLEAESSLFERAEPPFQIGEDNSYKDYCDVNSPQHYQKEGMEVIDIIDNFTPDPYSAYMANVIKYVLRHMDKGTPRKDLQKAQWYLNRMIKDWDQ